MFLELICRRFLSYREPSYTYCYRALTLALARLFLLKPELKMAVPRLDSYTLCLKKTSKIIFVITKSNFHQI